MTTPASAHAPSSWRGDPERDFVIYQLIEMARHVLDEYFSNDERVAEYQAPGRRSIEVLLDPKHLPELL